MNATTKFIDFWHI